MLGQGQLEALGGFLIRVGIPIELGIVKLDPPISKKALRVAFPSAFTRDYFIADGRWWSRAVLEDSPYTAGLNAPLATNIESRAAVQEIGVVALYEAVDSWRGSILPLTDYERLPGRRPGSDEEIETTRGYLVAGLEYLQAMSGGSVFPGIGDAPEMAKAALQRQTEMIHRFNEL